MCRGSRVEIVPRGVFRVEGGARPLEDVHASAADRAAEHGSGPTDRVVEAELASMRARPEEGVEWRALGDGLDGAVVAREVVFERPRHERGGREDARGRERRGGGVADARVRRENESATRPARASEDAHLPGFQPRQHVTLEDVGGQRRQRVDCRRRVGIRHRIGARPRASRGASRCGGKRAFARER